MIQIFLLFAKYLTSNAHIWKGWGADSAAYKSSFKEKGGVHVCSCSNLEFIQRWQVATFFSFKHPLQTLHNSGDHLIFFHYLVQKRILNPIGGLGMSQSAWSKRSKVMSYCDPSIRMSSQPRVIKKESRFCQEILDLKVVKRWEIGVKHLQNNVNHSSDTQGGEVTQGCPHTSKVMSYCDPSTRMSSQPRVIKKRADSAKRSSILKW